MLILRVVVIHKINQKHSNVGILVTEEVTVTGKR